MRGSIRIISVALWVLAVFCSNPFFPESGKLVKRPVESLRTTPQGVLDQIVKAYESKQIELYKDLFPEDGSFKFYVSPDFNHTFENSRYEKLSEPPDSRLINLEDAPFYYYWPQSVEIENHYKLFSSGVNIDFIDKPAVDVRFLDEGDTTAEMNVTGGMLEITRFMGDTAEVYTSSIEKQVMLVKKDSDDLWVLLKWYDFSHGE